ncbi:phage tail protein [Clostridium cellulovorans]|uniref:Tail Collar domain protein n=1 Tax=Clostridium cellulovorans (strain ATCC 35296 / DSM 3052 / OCM 3 / 743B) TaxID=573061 RepID=D9SMM5_CLOC7|nr:tail fiber protein [Clostridium cellulovorans]ADL49810.1 Tail Collar domain protein [Clostridium cellulovorans 743B]
MDPILAQIILWPGNFVPRGWLACEGQELPINQYTALYSLLGTTYGGNGSTTFKLPDLRGRVPVGSGICGGINFQQGNSGGNFNVTLTQQQMPAHTHSTTVTQGAVTVNGGIPFNGGEGTTNTPSASSKLAVGITAGGDIPNIYNTSEATGSVTGSFTGQVTGTTVTVGSAGGNQGVNVMQPFLALRYIIATEGIYPSRD